MRQRGVNVDDRGAFQLGREEMLLLAFGGGAIPLHFYFREHLACRQRLVQQRRGFVQRCDEGERHVYALAGWPLCGAVGVAIRCSISWTRIWSSWPSWYTLPAESAVKAPSVMPLPTSSLSKY